VIGRAIDEKLAAVRGVPQRASVRAACERVLVAIGIDSFRARVRLEVGGDPETSARVQRWVVILVDGAELWRGSYDARGQWSTTWTRDPATLG
jgi:hypothetical protein